MIYASTSCCSLSPLKTTSSFAYFVSITLHIVTCNRHEHIFHDFPIVLLFGDHFQIPWIFKVFQLDSHLTVTVFAFHKHSCYDTCNSTSFAWLTQVDETYSRRFQYMSICGSQTDISNLNAADLRTAVLYTCRMMAAFQHFHRDASSYQTDTSCSGFQDLDTLLVVASCAVVPDDHLHTRPVSNVNRQYGEYTMDNTVLRNSLTTDTFCWTYGIVSYRIFV